MVFILGICGASGSGKTTITKEIQHYFQKEYGNSSIIISLDMFYKDSSEYSPELFRHYQQCMAEENLDKPPSERLHFNFDNPELVDHEHAGKILQSIKHQQKWIQTYSLPIYNFQANRQTQTREIRVRQNDIILVEGIFLLHEHSRTLANIFDSLLFIEVNDSLEKNHFHPKSMYQYFATHKEHEIQLFLRRFQRDQERKCHASLLDFLYNWEHAIQSYYRYIKPYQYLCQFIFNNNQPLYHKGHYSESFLTLMKEIGDSSSFPKNLSSLEAVKTVK